MRPSVLFAAAWAVVGALVGALALAAPAAAAPSTRVVQGDHLRLVSVADWDRAAHLRPGEDVRWDVAVSADAPDPGTITLSLSAEGGAPLVVDAALCVVEWRGEDCPGGAATLRSGWSVPRDGEETRLAETDSRATVHLRLAVGLGEGSAGGSTRVAVHAEGAGDDLAVGPGGELPPTGAAPVGPGALAAAAALLVLGAGMLLARRRRHDGRGTA